MLSEPGNRSIALTSCLCKTMERMVNSRLTWYLERHMVITEYQSRCRRHRSTVDNLVILETSIRDAFVGRKHLVSIFFDLEKAYDTPWKHGILLDLYKTGLRGCLPMFICNFLSDRYFNIRVWNMYSLCRWFSYLLQFQSYAIHREKVTIISQQIRSLV